MVSKKLVNFFKTKDGRVVIAQFPNRPLLLAIGFYLLESFGTGDWKVLGSWGFVMALLYWSYLEIRFGVCGWRKFLGWAVLLWVVLGILR